MKKMTALDQAVKAGDVSKISGILNGPPKPVAKPPAGTVSKPIVVKR